MPVTVLPSGNLTVIVEPVSPVPVTCVLSLVTSFTAGAAGAVTSLTVALVSGDTLPDASVDVTTSSSFPTKSTVVGISIA